MKTPVLLLLIVACASIQAADRQGVGNTVTTPVQGHAEEAKGAHLRARVSDVVALVRARELDEAERAATDLQKSFEALFSPGVRPYSFQSKVEYLEFKESHRQSFEWIDWGYKECLQMRAFIASERRDFPAALAILSTIEAIAPVSAGTAAERGYILNQLGKSEEALLAYRQALSVSTRYPSQRPLQPVALRGIGFALIELHRLDEAEATFQESLNVEPNNRVALNELAYIRDLRSRR